MFESLFRFLKKDSPPADVDEAEARRLKDEIATTEDKLKSDPGNGELQKALMLLYNRALPVYARSPSYRQEVDAVFVRIDNLRDVIRRNI